MNPAPLIVAALTVLTLVLWTVFGLWLGPRLWRERNAGFIACASMAVLYFLFLVQFLSSGWLGEASNSAAVQALVAVAQAVFAIALIVLTVRTVQSSAMMAAETRVMAGATEKMAEETKKMADSALQQQQASIRPALVLRIGPVLGQSKPFIDRFTVEVMNVGAGPALDTSLFIEGPLRYKEPTSLVQPLAIAQGEALFLTFELESERPFLDNADPMRWPRTDEDAKLMREHERGDNTEDYLSADISVRDRYLHVRKMLRKRETRYYKDLTSRILSYSDVGHIRAVYRDLADGNHVSCAVLLVGGAETTKAVSAGTGEDEDDLDLFTPVWPEIGMGSLSVT